MLKKLFYIGLGISIIAVKKSASYLREKKEQLVDQGGEALGEAEMAPERSGTTPGIVEPPQAADDLTRINGIGPTYAKRLKESGITSFAELAEQSPEALQEITRATGKTADFNSWLSQAAELA